MLTLDKISLNQKQSRETQRRVQSAPRNLPIKISPGPEASLTNSVKQLNTGAQGVAVSEGFAGAVCQTLRRRNTDSLQSLPRDTSGGRGPAHPARPAGPAARHTRGDCGPARLVKLVRNPRRSTRKPSVTACWEGCVPCPRDACSWDARVVQHRKNQRDSPQQQNE